MQRSLAERLLADTAPEGRAALLEQLIDEFEAHGAAEEQTVFADLLGHPAARIPEHVAQHDQASELLLKLKEADGSSAEWVATFEIFAAALERHLKAERSGLLPLCRPLFITNTAELPGSRFRRHKHNKLHSL